MVASAFSMDLAFDLQQLDDAANDGNALLAQGITIIGDVGNPVARLRRLKTADTIRFTVYQLGHESDLEAYQVHDLSFSIKFRPSRPDQGQPSPVDGQCFEHFKIFRSSFSGQQSTVFELQRPVWFIELDAGGRSFPHGQLQSGQREAGDPVFDLKHTGAFYFTMQLRVTYSFRDRSRVEKGFRIDPEMIVTTSGSTPASGGGS